MARSGKSAHRHGNLGPRAADVYEAIRREHPGYSKTKSAKIANAVANHTANHKGGGKKK